MFRVVALGKRRLPAEQRRINEIISELPPTRSKEAGAAVLFKLQFFEFEEALKLQPRDAEARANLDRLDALLKHAN